mgnify:CR=1 FL=1
MCGGKLASGGSFYRLFHLWLLLGTRFFGFLGVQNLLFDRPGASIFHPGAYFVSLKTFEGAMEGYMGAQNNSLGYF